MAIYRNVQLSFWTDNKVEDDFTPEDRYFYIYLLTNPQTNICGCYEVSYSQMTRHLGYNKEAVVRLLERFETVHKVIKYNPETKEVLLLNWYKYNWNKSKDTLKGIKSVTQYIKCDSFKNYVLDVISCIENDIPVRGSIDPLEASMAMPPREASVSDSDTISDTGTDSDTVSDADTAEGGDGTPADPEGKGRQGEKSGKKRGNAGKKEEGMYFSNDMKLNQAFVEYIKMRKVIKKPMTERAIELAIRKLGRLSASPPSGSMDNDLAIRILEQSIMNCWQDLFPLKDTGQRGRQRNILEEWRNA